ncbi:MAG: threonine/serine exporter family protein [Firmicutes bacterium]|nr:threonine/serine exporter family protein [Bacillota bacterium]MBQ5797016.1 threonine/serine exporter family protein [Bacillota bacterium]
MLLQFIAGIGSTVGYALIFNQPRRHLIPTGLIGAAGWILYLVAVEVGYGDAFASFLSAFLVTFLSQIAARVFKDPVMVFCIPGIMPIVPGAGMYRTMRAFVTHETALAAATGYATISMAGAIALGLLAATSLFQVMTAVNRTFFKK